MLQRIQRIADHLKKTTGATPETGIILGTGLSGLARDRGLARHRLQRHPRVPA